MKTLKILRTILERIKGLSDPDDEDSFAKACHERVQGLEDEEDLEDVFRRRMGMRHYLNQLKLSLVRVKNAKKAKEEAKKR